MHGKYRHQQDRRHRYAGRRHESTHGYRQTAEYFDQFDHTLSVKVYLLRESSGVWRRRGRIHPDEVVMCSPELMLIRERSSAKRKS